MSVFFGGSVVAAVVAGAIALFAPCCVSVMLPAYFAASFHNRRVLVAMTFLFGAGVATVILPIALGASFLRRVILGGHTAVYLAGAALLIGLGVYTLLGGRLRLPTPTGPQVRSRGPFAVYGLGVFSGLATSCCAPVLVGVVTLSGVAGSFLASLGLGLAYVVGMVAPLLGIAWLWDRRDWSEARLFRPRSISYRIGPWRRTISAAALLSGLLLVAMGVWALWMAVAGGMGTTVAWQASLELRLERLGHGVTDALRWLPGWAAGLALAGAVAALGVVACRQLGWLTPNRGTAPLPDGVLPEHQTEDSVEHQDQSSPAGF